MSKELEALERVVNEISNYKLHGIGGENWLGIQDILKDIDIIEKALNELEDAKHNYKAVKEMYDNSVAYGTRIQKELNEFKKRNEPMKVDSSKHYVGLGYFKCPKCGGLFIGNFDNYCSDCGQKLDWSDEK